MEDFFKQFATIVSTLLEATAVLLIAFGALESMFRFVTVWLKKTKTEAIRRITWLNFVQWILLGLEFTLAADIVKTAIAPTWDSIGQLSAIAVMRTFLSYFLERDLESARHEMPEAKNE
jgi:uncharacterized membrane protein